MLKNIISFDNIQKNIHKYNIYNKKHKIYG